MFFIRAKNKIDNHIKNKISLFTNAHKDAVFSAQDASNISNTHEYKNQN